VAEVVKQLVVVADVEVDAAQFAVIRVRPDGIRQEVIPAVGLARLVGQRIELEIVFRDPAEAIGGQNVPGEGLALHARSAGHAGERIVKLIAGVDLKQR